MTLIQTEIEAAFEAIEVAAETGELWGERIFQDIVPSKAVWPYFLFWRVGGGRQQRHISQPTANMVIAITVVSEKYATAQTGAQRIDELYADAGAQDTGATITATTDWNILTITGELPIHQPLEDNSLYIWRIGRQFRFIMEAK